VFTLKQLEGEGRPRRPRWWRARRTPVSDEPIRWKERHVDGLAPLAMLRPHPALDRPGCSIRATFTASSAIIFNEHQGQPDFVRCSGLPRESEIQAPVCSFWSDH